MLEPHRDVDVRPGWDVTYARSLDGIRNFDEKLLVLGGVLPPHEDLNGVSAALHLVEVLGY